MDSRNQDGTFKAGHSGYKPRGSINEFQKVTREKLGDFLNQKLDDLPAIYSKLSDKEKARLLLGVCEFFLPKQKELVVELEDTRARVAALFPWNEPEGDVDETEDKA